MPRDAPLEEENKSMITRKCGFCGYGTLNMEQIGKTKINDDVLRGVCPVCGSTETVRVMISGGKPYYGILTDDDCERNDIIAPVHDDAFFEARDAKIAEYEASHQN